jgi:hypothetical protein
MNMQKLKNNRAKVWVISLLVVLLVIQTKRLWLGNVSSLNFLEQNTISPIMPSKIWINKGNIFPLNNSQSEYFRIVDEISLLMRGQISKDKMQVVEGFTWTDVVGKQGLLFEYEQPISVGGIIGSSLINNEDYLLDRVFVNMSNLLGGRIEVYFFSNLKQGGYRLVLESQALDFKKLYQSIHIESSVMPIRYEASIGTLERFIRGNTYLPLVSKNNPLEYKKKILYNPLEEEEDLLVAIEQRIGAFFLNPLTKSKEILEDGTFVFTENMRSIVTYKPQGVIEYINLAASDRNSEMSMAEGYTVAMNFIQASPSTVAYKKQNIYLKKVEKDEFTYTYYFDWSDDGYKTRLSPEVKKHLGIESMIVLTVKNKQVISGKWSILELREARGVHAFTTEYIEVINKMYQVIEIEEDQDIVIDSLECVYVIESLTRPIELQWSAVVDGRRYYFKGE